MFLVSIYFYNEVAVFDRRRYFIFYLFLGILYVVIGVNSLFLVLTIISSIKLKKKVISPSDVRFFLEIEGMVNYYLKKNEGKTYTAKALVSKLENYLKDHKRKEYFKTNIETMLSQMVQRGTIQQIQENGETIYSF